VLASAEVIPYSLPFRAPYLTARGILERRQMALLRIRDSDGVEGLGEAVPLSLRGGATLEQVVEELGGWSDSRKRGPEGLSPPSRCAIETALLDLRARREGAPAWRRFGATVAEPVQCNATLAAGAPREVAAMARHWAERGFRSFKLKVGVAEDREQVAAVRRELGPDARLRVDANGAWDPARAVASLHAMESEGVFLAEQPCASLEEMAEVAAQVDLWLAADESVESARQAERARALGACRLATAKLSKVGGPDEALSIGRRLPTYLSSALDGPVGIAAAAHTAQALREQGGDAGIPHGLATQRLFAATIASVECELRGDHLHVPEGPGLGVEIDEAALARHRL
jgi:L-alanine-DL-glutamate epimerase-like enolase superfamily enzyme